MIEDNLKEVRARIQRACETVGRKPEEINLIAVSKYASLEAAQELAQLGVQDFGENRLPQAFERAQALKEQNVHFIGHLQTNKVNKVVGHFCCIHSLDRASLFEAVIKKATELKITQDVFVQINISAEESKGGYAPEELPSVLETYKSVESINILGLMTMAPNGLDEGGLRSIFKKLSELAKKFGLLRTSMGMSNDFEIAVEEGATDIRVGSLLFKTEAVS
jgi:pyridoxal phosphate enzyme (YggS family)